jgi:hypothetical protein
MSMALIICHRRRKIFNPCVRERPCTVALVLESVNQSNCSLSNWRLIRAGKIINSPLHLLCSLWLPFITHYLQQRVRERSTPESQTPRQPQFYLLSRAVHCSLSLRARDKLQKAKLAMPGPFCVHLLVACAAQITRNNHNNSARRHCYNSALCFVCEYTP